MKKKEQAEMKIKTDELVREQVKKGKIDAEIEKERLQNKVLLQKVSRDQ